MQSDLDLTMMTSVRQRRREQETPNGDADMNASKRDKNVRPESALDHRIIGIMIADKTEAANPEFIRQFGFVVDAVDASADSDGICRVTLVDVNTAKEVQIYARLITVLDSTQRLPGMELAIEFRIQYGEWLSLHELCQGIAVVFNTADAAR